MPSLAARIKELARHSAVYGVGSLVSRFIAVLLLPLYTRFLSPADYGLIETLIALSAVLTVLLAAGVKSAFFRFYFDDEDKRRGDPDVVLVHDGERHSGARRRAGARRADLRAAVRHLFARRPRPCRRSSACGRT